MRRLRTWRSFYDHDEFGEISVLWTWRRTGRSWTPTPIAIQFGLWVPAAEREALVALLEDGTFPDFAGVPSQGEEKVGLQGRPPCCDNEVLPWE